MFIVQCRLHKKPTTKQTNNPRNANISICTYGQKKNVETYKQLTQLTLGETGLKVDEVKRLAFSLYLSD